MFFFVENGYILFHSILCIFNQEQFHPHSIPLFVINGSILVPFFVEKRGGLNEKEQVGGRGWYSGVFKGVMG